MTEFSLAVALASSTVVLSYSGEFIYRLFHQWCGQHITMEEFVSLSLCQLVTMGTVLTTVAFLYGS